MDEAFERPPRQPPNGPAQLRCHLVITSESLTLGVGPLARRATSLSCCARQLDSRLGGRRPSRHRDLAPRFRTSVAGNHAAPALTTKAPNPGRSCRLSPRTRTGTEAPRRLGRNAGAVRLAHHVTGSEQEHGCPSPVAHFPFHEPAATSAPQGATTSGVLEPGGQLASKRQ